MSSVSSKISPPICGRTDAKSNGPVSPAALTAKWMSRVARCLLWVLPNSKCDQVRVLLPSPIDSTRTRGQGNQLQNPLLDGQILSLLWLAAPAPASGSRYPRAPVAVDQGTRPHWPAVVKGQGAAYG